MEQNRLDYYKESGIAPPLNITLVLICSFITILFFSYLYSLITTYLPLIYFNFLIAIGFGFTISFTSRIFNVLFKIRNRKMTIITTVVISIFAIYFQWVSYLFIISYEDIGAFNIFSRLNDFFIILFRPDLVIRNIIDINKIGLWSLGTSNINIRGLILWLVWLAEASIILFISINNFINFDIIPFSEKDNKWFKKEFIDFDFEHIAYKKLFVEEFSSHPYESINKLKKGNGLRHSKISLFKSETESKSLITVNNIIVTQRGKGKKDITNVLKLCYIDNMVLSQLKGKYTIKKASIFDY